MRREEMEKIKEGLFTQEIKIRVYHPDEDKIYYFKSFEDIMRWQGAFSASVDTDGSEMEYLGIDVYRSENPNEGCKSVTFMQWLGHDSHGNDIYQGDIISIKWKENGEKQEVKNIATSYNVFFLTEEDVTITRIGNIYENPEIYN